MEDRPTFPLAVIACGFEHGGTTLLTEVLRMSSVLEGGFEGGLLLNDTPAPFLRTEPYRKNLLSGWGLSERDVEYICEASNFGIAYTRLRERSTVISSKESLLFDKTPRYMSQLPEVMSRAPDVSAVVILRDLRATLWSSFKRTRMSVVEWEREIYPVTRKHLLSYIRGLARAVERPERDRLFIVRHEDLLENPSALTEELFSFLRLPYIFSATRFEQPTYRHVHGGGLRKSVNTEYQGKLPERVCEEIIDLSAPLLDQIFACKRFGNGRHPTRDKSYSLLGRENSGQATSTSDSGVAGLQPQDCGKRNLYRWQKDIGFHIPKLALLEVWPLNVFLRDRRDMVVIDVGAHTGLWCNAFLNTFGVQTAEYHAIEPVQANLALFSERLEAFLGLERKKVRFAAMCAGASDGSVELHYNEKALALASVVIEETQVGRSKIRNDQKVVVEEISLSSYASATSIKKVDVLKIDVEGYEWEVLQGANTLFRDGIVELAIFAFGQHQGRVGQTFREFWGFFKQYGYHIYRQSVSRNFFGFQYIHEYDASLEDFSSMWMIIAARQMHDERRNSPCVIGKYRAP